MKNENRIFHSAFENIIKYAAGDKYRKKLEKVRI